MDVHVRLIVRITLVLFSFSARAQFNQSDKALASQYFAEAVQASGQDKGHLWGIPLYGPMLFINAQTRDALANVPDESGILTIDGTLFMGKLPQTVSIANTAVQWQGQRWTMILWPLPSAKPERLNLMMHELFHRIQPQLDLAAGPELNPQLDERMGRILLRLELKALQQAIGAHDNVRTQHVHQALLFRYYRRQLFAGADSTEDNLERNEGLAEYTGLMLSGRTNGQMQTHLTQLLAKAQQTKSFVRSFAYLTGPAYGFLLQERQPDWNHHLARTVSIAGLVKQMYDWKAPTEWAPAYQRAKAGYEDQVIEAEENQLDQDRQAQLNRLRQKFLTDNRLLIGLHKMQVSFNPGNLVSLPQQGTVYPTMRLTDEWGTLDVTNEALIASDWSQVTVGLPAEINIKERIIKTADWTLTLKEPWSIQPQGDHIWRLTDKRN